MASPPKLETSTDKSKKEKTENKRPRVSSSTSEDNEEQVVMAELLKRISLVEQAVEREARITSLETQLANANLTIQKLKKKTNDLQNSIEFTQKDQAEALERIAECEQEQANQDDEPIRQEIYSRRWNMILYKVPETRDEDCTGLVQKVITNDLKIKREEVNQFQFCGVHRLGKQSCGRPRPIIARFTCRSDRDKVWKMRRNLKDSNISIGEDLPKGVQEIKRKILIPAMKKARSLDPRNKAAVIGDKLVVNGRQYLHFNIPKRWLDNQPSADPNEEPIDHDGVMSLNATPEQEPTAT